MVDTGSYTAELKLNHEKSGAPVVVGLVNEGRVTRMGPCSEIVLLLLVSNVPRKFDYFFRKRWPQSLPGGVEQWS